MSVISTTHKDCDTASYEEVTQTELSIYDINKLIETLLFASCTSVTSEWEPEECVYFLRLATVLKKQLQDLGKPVVLSGIKLFLEPDNIFEDEWAGVVVDEFGEYIETWTADPEDSDEPCCQHPGK
jgi:hypothetical protein